MFHDWSRFSDIIFYQPIMLRNTSKMLELEIMRGNTERGQKLAVGLEKELAAIREMDKKHLV